MYLLRTFGVQMEAGSEIITQSNLVSKVAVMSPTKKNSSGEMEPLSKARFYLIAAVCQQSDATLNCVEEPCISSLLRMWKAKCIVQSDTLAQYSWSFKESGICIESQCNY